MYWWLVQSTHRYVWESVNPGNMAQVGTPHRFITAPEMLEKWLPGVRYAPPHAA